jgi:hypothetical protein
MKSLRVLSFLRNSFYFLEWASAILAILLIVQCWILAPFELSTPGLRVGPPIYKFQFELEPPLSSLVYHGTTTGNVWVTNFRADVLIGQAPTPSTLLNFYRWRATSNSLLLLMSCAIFSLVRRLFDNVKQGDVFSFRSVQQIRLMGWCFLLYSAVASLMNSALDWFIARDLLQHISIAGLRTAFVSADYEGGMNFWVNQLHIKLDLTSVFMALLAFALSEVFRQGLLLRQENELTV